jgi:biopolymer transport protein ExbD
MALRIGYVLLIAVIVSVFAFTVAANYGIGIVGPRLELSPKQAHAPRNLDLRGGSSVIIAVDRDGQIYWNGKPISCQDMNAKLVKMFKKSQGARPSFAPCARPSETGAPAKPN